MSDIPKGYIFAAAAKSVREAVNKSSVDRIKTITKMAVQNYIDSFFNTTGLNRGFLEAVGKNSLQYISDRSFDPNDDLTKRKMQIARLMQEVRGDLPAILIIDGGFEYTPSTIGTMVDNSEVRDNIWYGQFNVRRNIPLTILAASNDTDTTDMLVSSLSLLFGELRHVAGGSNLQGTKEHDSWLVRLPLIFDAGPLTTTQVENDPKDSVYHADISMVVSYESNFTLHTEMDKSRLELPEVDDPNIQKDPVIEFPDTIHLGETHDVRVSHFHPDRYKVIVDDGRFAIIDQANWTVMGRKLGKFKIFVVKTQEDQGKLGTDAIAAEKNVEVVYG